MKKRSAQSAGETSRYPHPSRASLSLALAFGLCCAVSQSFSAVVYDFDALTLGNLTTSNTAGQDNWYRDSALGGPDLQVISASSGSPTSQAISVTYGTTSERAIRQFGTDFFTGTETSAQISFTFQKNSLAVGIQMALGNGSTPTTYINTNTPADFGPRLYFGNANQFGIIPKTTNGAYGTPTASSAQTLTLGDWYAVTLTMDFTANGGNGAGSISYTDLTTSQTFANVVSGANLGLLNQGANFGPDDWNQVYLRMDQLSTGGPAGTMALSEFSINPIPEPTTLGLLFAGLLGFLFRRRIRRSIG